MHDKLKGFLVPTLVILVLGPVVSITSTAGQESQDRETRTQAGPPHRFNERGSALRRKSKNGRRKGRTPSPLAKFCKIFSR